MSEGSTQGSDPSASRDEPRTLTPEVFHVRPVGCANMTIIVDDSDDEPELDVTAAAAAAEFHDGEWWFIL